MIGSEKYFFLLLGLGFGFGFGLVFCLFFGLVVLVFSNGMFFFVIPAKILDAEKHDCL